MSPRAWPKSVHVPMSHWPAVDKQFAKMAVNYLEIHFEMSGCLLQLQIDKWATWNNFFCDYPMKIMNYSIFKRVHKNHNKTGKKKVISEHVDNDPSVDIVN